VADTAARCTRRTPPRAKFSNQINDVFFCKSKKCRSDGHFLAPFNAKNGLGGVELMPENTKKAKKGRPSRRDELRKAIEEVGVNPLLVDPYRILSALAIDSKVAPTTRIQACLALIEHPPQAGQTGKPGIIPDSSPSAPATKDPGVPDDEISRRTMEILKRGTSR
jgi:hypothetical protein